MTIVEQEADVAPIEGITFAMPDFMTEVVAQISQLARQSSSINQRSGVSVRMSVTNYEALAAAALQK